MYKYLVPCDVRILKRILICIFISFFHPVLSSIDSDSAANGRDRFFPPRCESRLVHTTGYLTQGHVHTLKAVSHL